MTVATGDWIEALVAQRWRDEEGVWRAGPDGRFRLDRVGLASGTHEDLMRDQLRRLAGRVDPHLVPLLGAAEEEQCLWLAWEEAGARSLAEVQADRRLTGAEAVAVAAAALAGLEALQRAGLSHGQLDASAVMVGPHGDVRLTGYAAHPRFGSRGLVWPDPGRDVAATGRLLSEMLGLEPASAQTAGGRPGVPAALGLLALGMGGGSLGRRPGAAREMLLDAAGELAAPAALQRARSELGALASGAVGAPPAPPLTVGGQGTPLPPAPLKAKHGEDPERPGGRGGLGGGLLAALAALMLIAAAAWLLHGLPRAAPAARPVRPPAATAAVGAGAAAAPITSASATPPASAPPQTSIPQPITPAQPVVPAQDQPVTSHVGPATPQGAVGSFYDAVVRHDYETAVGLWSARMRSDYPPNENVSGRFELTTSITVNDDHVIRQSGNSATVQVDLVEVSGGQRRHWVGTWDLVRGERGWLLDRPHLQAAASS